MATPPLPPIPILDVYDSLGEVSLHLKNLAGCAVIEYSLEGKRRTLRLEGPRPLAALLSVLDPYCYGFRIYDRNAENAGQLEFGRYRVEFRDEDGPIAECIADRFEEGDPTD